MHTFLLSTHFAFCPTPPKKKTTRLYIVLFVLEFVSLNTNIDEHLGLGRFF